jgi:hypothetical protein
VLQGNFELTSPSILDCSPEYLLINGLREDIRKPKEKKHKYSTVKRQCLRAENIIVEWQRAQEILPALQEAAVEDDIRSIQAQPGSTVPHESPKPRSSSALVKNQETTLAVIKTAAASASGSKSEKRALILQNTDNWLNQLLSEWTVLSGEPQEIMLDVNEDTPEELSHEDQSPAPNVEASRHGGKHHHPTEAKSGGHVGDIDIRMKRAAEELAKLHQEKRVSSFLGQPSTPTQDYQDGRICEEREPSGFYSEEGYHYREEEPQTATEKYDVFELERRPYARELEKEKKSTKLPEEAPYDVPYNIAAEMKAKAKQRMQEKETTDKQSNRQTYVEDDSSSGSDTATYVTTNRPRPRTSKPVYDLPPYAKLKPEPTRKPTSSREKEEDEEEDNWPGAERVRELKEEDWPRVERVRELEEDIWPRVERVRELKEDDWPRVKRVRELEKRLRMERMRELEQERRPIVERVRELEEDDWPRVERMRELEEERRLIMERERDKWPRVERGGELEEDKWPRVERGGVRRRRKKAKSGILSLLGLV